MAGSIACTFSILSRKKGSQCEILEMKRFMRKPDKMRFIGKKKTSPCALMADQRDYGGSILETTGTASVNCRSIMGVKTQY